jgi:hypothetical protein
MNGPHCPKCGSHSDWSEYANNGDALICDAMRVSTFGDPAKCSYIHWLRNAPPLTEEEKDNILRNAAKINAEHEVVEDTRRAKWELECRRKRVRKLVHSMLLSPSAQFFIEGEPSIVVLAERMDSAIEAVTNIQGSDS